MEQHEQLPNLSLFQISTHVADLLLVSAESEEWVRERSIRTAWHAFFLSAIGLLVVNWGVFALASDSLTNNPHFATAFRAIMTLGYTWLLFLVLLMTYCHYRYLLLTGKDLRFNSIAFLYVAATLTFARLYGSVYVLDPTLFTFPAAPFRPSDKLMRLGSKNFVFLADFLVYSGCTSVSLNYPRIASASLLVSVLNIVQVLFSLLVAGLMIATFVQKTTTPAERK